MQKTFIETRNFTESVGGYLSDDQYAELQAELLANPDKGDVMPGCGGLRKVRTADPRRRKGKRSGARVIYLHIAEVNQIYLLDIYGKHEKDDLSAEEKKVLRQLARELKTEAVARYRRQRGEQE